MGIAAMVFTSCENDPFLYNSNAKLYLSGDAAQEAKKDSVFFSFKVHSSDVVEYTLNLQVHLIGPAVDQDRPFTLEVVDTMTNVPASAYSAGSFVLPAGKSVVTVPIKVKRSVEGLDLTKNNAKLTYRVVPNDEFEAGITDAQTYSIVWCDYLIKPASWDIVSYYVGNFSQARFKFIIDFTGYTEFTSFDNDYNKQMWFQGYLRRLLEKYNSDPANEGREEGWPYKDDNGDALIF